MALKSLKGRLTPEGVERIKNLRNSANPKTGKAWTYQQIAAELDVCLSTVYSVLKGKTHAR